MNIKDKVVKNLEYNYKHCKLAETQIDKKTFMDMSFGVIGLAIDVDPINVKNYIKMWNHCWKPMFEKEVYGL